MARDFYVNVSYEIYYDSKPFEIMTLLFILFQDTIAITSVVRCTYIVHAANCFLMHHAVHGTQRVTFLIFKFDPNPRPPPTALFLR